MFHCGELIVCSTAEGGLCVPLRGVGCVLHSEGGGLRVSLGGGSCVPQNGMCHVFYYKGRVRCSTMGSVGHVFYSVDCRGWVMCSTEYGVDICVPQCRGRVMCYTA